MPRWTRFVLTAVIGGLVGSGVTLLVVGRDSEPLVDVGPVTAAPTSSTPSPTPSPASGEPLEIRQTGITPLGNEVTLFGWAPEHDRGFPPEAGTVHMSLDAEFCLTGEVSEGNSIDAFDISSSFALELENNRRIVPSVAGNELGNLGTIRMGDCVRGDVVFDAPIGARPQTALFFSTDSTLRWVLE